MQVDGNRVSWLVILAQLYPLHPKEITHQNAAEIVPLLHKYHIDSGLQYCDDFLSEQAPSLTFTDPKSHSYAFKWISVSEKFNLDRSRRILMGKIKLLILSKKLDIRSLFTSSSMSSSPWPYSVEPQRCSYGHLNCSVCCSVWCPKCKGWRCSQDPGTLRRGVCLACATILAPSCPQLLPSITHLSTKTKDEILALLFLAATVTVKS